jgi:hypothetical protein
MLDKHPTCPSVFGLYNKAACEGDVVIKKQYSAIVDTRVPVTSTPFPPFGLGLLQVERRTYSDRILEVGHR